MWRKKNPCCASAYTATLQHRLEVDDTITVAIHLLQQIQNHAISQGVFHLARLAIRRGVCLASRSSASINGLHGFTFSQIGSLIYRRTKNFTSSNQKSLGKFMVFTTHNHQILGISHAIPQFLIRPTTKCLGVVEHHLQLILGDLAITVPWV